MSCRPGTVSQDACAVVSSLLKTSGKGTESLRIEAKTQTGSGIQQTD